MTTIADYRVVILHENAPRTRSHAFATIEEAESWARTNLNPTPRSSKHYIKYCKMMKMPLNSFDSPEMAEIMGRKEGRNLHTVVVKAITADML